MAITAPDEVAMRDDGSPPVSVLLVDDNAAFLNAAARLLERHGALAVVGRATSGDEALALAERLRPDVVLMDLVMPGMNGLEATRRLKARSAPPRVLALTLHDDPCYRQAAAESGADGFVAKADLGTALLPTLVAWFPSLA